MGAFSILKAVPEREGGKRSLTEGFKSLLSGEGVERSKTDEGKTLKISQMDLQKMQCNCILIKVLLNFFQKIVRGLGQNPKVFIIFNLVFYVAAD